eukprot:CAMPEP_0171107372 /NCGR_PEP_ID=MMETSP0766_2-20121228/66668_1 /TAXON_ID=439317 /ORGANISM="Gambierdiscus australes, Strain CAWD 149" /LENGTH=219 /DNA_ID=CAMNT_0011568659 /DNA_START=215 /DNA_END=874 /DNA_ORIENTATION=+
MLGGMAAGNEHLGEDTAHLSFSNVDFLQRHGLHPRNVLEYFYTSPFYARCGGMTSANEARRRGHQAPLSGDVHEFMLTYSNNAAKSGRIETSVYVIQKISHRTAQDGTVPSDTFYIVAGSIYKAPQLGELFERTVHQTTSAVDAILQRQVEPLKLPREAEEPGAPKREAGASGTGAGDCDSPLRWPAWCIFEKRPLPGAWIFEAVRAAAPAKRPRIRSN